MSYHIEIGDRVEVVFREGECFTGIVRHMPQATGDSWIIETEKSVAYIQNYEAIWKPKVQP